MGLCVAVSLWRSASPSKIIFIHRRTKLKWTDPIAAYTLREIQLERIRCNTFIERFRDIINRLVTDRSRRCKTLKEKSRKNVAQCPTHCRYTAQLDSTHSKSKSLPLPSKAKFWSYAARPLYHRLSSTLSIYHESIKHFNYISNCGVTRITDSYGEFLKQKRTVLYLFSNRSSLSLMDRNGIESIQTQFNLNGNKSMWSGNGMKNRGMVNIER